MISLRVQAGRVGQILERVKGEMGEDAPSAGNVKKKLTA
jgi:hypothetical protein